METVTAKDETNTPTAIPRWQAIAIPGVAMSLGWGLRGQFGGPRGAMVPGALVALALVLVARRRPSPAQVWLAAAAGSLGFAIGAEEPYMQTVGRIMQGVTVPWAYLGLLLKGGVWGGLGGLFVGSALGRKRYTPTQLLLAFNLALALAFVGFWLINEPRLLYFSGHSAQHSRAKTEGWAGLWCLYLTLLFLAARAGDRTAVRLSLYGALGCGGGFVLGVLAFILGDRSLGAATRGWMDWWKVAECGLGLIGGSTLGAAWASAEQEEPLDRPEPPNLLPPAAMIVLALDLLLVLYIADDLDNFGGWIGKAPFAFLAPALLLSATRSLNLALLLGVTIPVAVTLWNVQEYWVVEAHLLRAGPSLAGLIALTALTAVSARRWSPSPRALFLLVAWAAVGCAWVKMCLPLPADWRTALLVQGIFTVMAGWLTWTLRDRPSVSPEPLTRDEDGT